MNNYEKLRSKVNEILPERVEKLEPLSDVMYQRELYTYIEDDEFLEHRLLRNGKTYTKRRVLTKNLGKPLTILDVMAAHRQVMSEEEDRHTIELHSCGFLTCGYDFDKIIEDVTAPLSTQESLCGELIKLFK